LPVESLLLRRVIMKPGCVGGVVIPTMPVPLETAMGMTVDLKNVGRMKANSSRMSRFASWPRPPVDEDGKKTTTVVSSTAPLEALNSMRSWFSTRMCSP